MAPVVAQSLLMMQFTRAALPRSHPVLPDGPRAAGQLGLVDWQRRDQQDGGFGSNTANELYENCARHESMPQQGLQANGGSWVHHVSQRTEEENCDREVQGGWGRRRSGSAPTA